MRRALGLLVIVVAAGRAGACPLCDSETGRAVRAGVFDGSFLANLGVLLAPFPVIAGASVLVHGPRERGRITGAGARA